MAIDWAVWGPPALVLGVGVAFGLLTVSRLRGPADVAISDEGRRRDLESTRDEVLEQLKQLELEKDKMPPADYERERHALLARGSRALEALDTGGWVAPSPQTSAAGAPSPAPAATTAGGAPATGLAPEWKGALYMLAALGLVFGLWQFAQSESVTRREGASMTGNQNLGVESDPAEALRADAGFQQQLADLEAKVAANPEDYAAHNDLTHLYLMSNDPGKAIQHNDLVLKADPKNLDARTYRGLLAVMMGLADKGLEQLDAVLADNPDHTRAIVYRAMILFQQGKMQEAVDALTAAAAAHPDDMELHSALAQAKQAMSAPPPPMGGPASGAPGGGGEVIVAGTAELDPSLAAALTGSETLFVSVSDPARPKPPVAADRVNGPLKFPLAFEITTDEIRAMPGAGGVPELLDLKVRIDTDGNAMTQEAAPLAVVTGVHKGAGGLVVKLTLDGAPVAAPAGGGSSLVAPLAPAPAGASASGGGELLASGVANLRSGSVTGSEMVFVSVRDPAGGPPYASKKVPAAFPLTFTLTTADVIQMGGARPIPDTFNVVVRVDRDGNAMTKDGEPEATATSVKKGATKLELWLE